MCAPCKDEIAKIAVAVRFGAMPEAGTPLVKKGNVMAKKRLPLPKRFSAGLTETAYARLRTLNADWGLGNNYLLVVLLENLDRYADKDKLDDVFRAFIEEYGAPSK